MESIGIGEIQKNSSIFSHLKKAIQIVDKRKKKVLAVVYPVKNQNIVKMLAGKYKNKIQKKATDLQVAKEIALKQAMEEKYGLSS